MEWTYGMDWTCEVVYFRLIEGALFHPVLTQLNAFLLKPLLTKTTYSTDKNKYKS